MQSIEKHPIYQEKERDFLQMNHFLQDELRLLAFDGAVAYGSVIRKEVTSSDLSDIDIVAYSPLLSRKNAEQLIAYIHGKTVPFFDKAPIFIEDHITARIEFSIYIGSTVFDVSIFPSELSGYSRRYTNTIHDSLDVVIGAMYLNAWLLFGAVPFETLIHEQFLPFYSDDLRDVRLNQLVKRIQICLDKLDLAIKRGEDDLLQQIFKTRSYLIKWMFIHARKYPVDCNRYLKRQLSEELQIPDTTIDCLLLRGESLPMVCKQFAITARALLADEERNEKNERI